MTAPGGALGVGTVLRRYATTVVRRYPLVVTVLLVAGGILTGAVLSGALPADAAQHIAPTVAICLVFAVFWVVLQHRIGGAGFGELGFVYMGLLLAYTVFPALAFLGAGIYEGGPLGALLPEASALRTHLWRHVLFAAGVAAGYLLLRGSGPEVPTTIEDSGYRDGRALLVAAVAAAVLVISLRVMSAPVETYWEHYQRYDHLPWLLRKISSLFIRMSLGLYCVLLVLLFRNYRKYRYIIPVVVAGIAAYEIVYSFGARIQALIVVLQAACLYHFMVRRISVRGGVAAIAVLVVLFSVVEIVRTLDFGVASASDVLAEEGVQPAGELTSVFFPGFHLYAERAAGTLPPRAWPMFFHDLISLFTFGDFTRFNPMSWYHANYFPEADVSPFTLGPIADSALWGGEPDLLMRGLINGAFFAVIMRWFLRYGGRWWGMTVYAYCFATCILTLKYSVFLHLTLIEKNLLPVLVLVYAARVLRFSRSAPVPAANSA